MPFDSLDEEGVEEFGGLVCLRLEVDLSDLNTEGVKGRETKLAGKIDNFRLIKKRIAKENAVKDILNGIDRATDKS